MRILAESAYLDATRRLSRGAQAALRDMLEARFPSRTLARCRPESFTARKVVLRLEFEAHRSGPRSAFVAAAAGRGGTAVAHLNREVAAIRYLRALADETLRHAAPEIFGHDPSAGVVLIEDLHASGGGVRLHELLVRPGREPAAAALRTLAHTLGRLHAATFRRHLSCRTSPGPEPASEATRTPILDRRIRQLRSRLRRYGLDLDAQSARELEAAHTLLYGGADQAFCHGDVSPMNVFVGPSGIRFCDFEFAGFRHPVLDGMHLGWLFPISVDAGGIPSSLIRELQLVYRQQFDLREHLDARGIEKVESAALILLSFHHWVFSSPELGLPLGFAGARAKVLELAQMMRSLGEHRSEPFPAIASLFVHAATLVARENSLAPDASVVYESFRRGASSGSPAPPDAARLDTDATVTGTFRVNRSCHIVVRKHDAARISVHILQHPAMQAQAQRSAPGVFEASAMPFRMIAQGGRIVIEDVRTGKRALLTRERAATVFVIYLQQLIRMLVRRCVAVAVP